MVNKSALSVFCEWVDGYLNFEKTPQKNIFWLDTMQFLCKRFGNPQNSCPAFHVAGSKGKGSVSAMIASILTAAGKYTGVYSSPHIVDFSERIRTVQGVFPEEVYAKSASEVMGGIDSIMKSDLPGERPLTWFEIVTLFAMVCFKNAGTDYSVYEVGLGGRLDSTNIITPVCSCISAIELEHTEFLGDTVEKIALEKGGIIKNGIPVIVAGQKDSVKDVFRKIARERNAEIEFVDEVSKVSEVVYKTRQENGKTHTFMHTVISSDKFKRPLSVDLRLLGEFQAQNAALAALAVKYVIPELDESVIEKGLSEAVLPGRFEITHAPECYSRIPQIILDGAHTVKSVSFTVDTFEKLFGNKSGSTAHLLFACAADKDVEDIAPLFSGKFSDIIITKPGDAKASDVKRAELAFNAANEECTVCSDYNRAIKLALEKACHSGATLLVTGSFYLVAEVKKYLSGLKCTC